MNEIDDRLVELTFALGTTVYTTPEYSSLVLDLIRAGVLTEKAHAVFAIMEPTGVLLNPKWLRGYTYFSKQGYAEAYLAGLLEQLGGMRGVPYLMVYITDPFVDGADLIRSEREAAERERKLPSWMKMLEGGKSDRASDNEQEAGEGVAEKDLQSGTGVQVPERGMLSVLRSDSHASTGTRSDKVVLTEENDPQGIDGAESNPGTGQRGKRSRTDLSTGGQEREVPSLPSPPINVPDDGELQERERGCGHGLPGRPGESRNTSPRVFQDVQRRSQVLRSKESDSLEEELFSDDDEITDA